MPEPFARKRSRSVINDDPPTVATQINPDAPIHRGVKPVGYVQPTARDHVALPLGYSLNEYTIEALLGTGGFAITYLARDNNLQCQVAIKEYLPNDLAVRTHGEAVRSLAVDAREYRAGLERFLAESRVLASFRHPNIVRVSRFFEANDTAYMVMDYEQGEPLREWIVRNDPVDEALLLKMFLPLLDGLDVVHQAGVLHRDIKPANIYVRAVDGSLVLLDFGAARRARNDNSQSMTSIVTPGYAPFEQYHTRGVQGPWSDLYAFGGILYWVVTGEKPLEAPARVRDDPMASALSLAADHYSARLLRAIDWALTPEESARPQSVAQLKAVLTGQAAVPVDVQSSATSAGAVAAKYRPPPLVKLALAVFLLTVAIVTFYPKPKAESNAPPAAERLAPRAHDGGARRPRANAPSAAIPAATADTTPNTTADTPAPASTGSPRTGAAQSRLAAAGKKAAVGTPGPVGTLILDVTPRGRVVVDGRPMGLSPPLTYLTLTADAKHKIEIYGNGPSYFRTVELKPGEKQRMRAEFQ